MPRKKEKAIGKSNKVTKYKLYIIKYILWIYVIYYICIYIFYIYIYIHNINIHNSYIHNINTCIFLFIFINFFLLVTFLLFTASIATPNNENTRIYNLGQNIWNKMKKSSKTGQEKKSLASFLVFFFNCYCQSLIPWRETRN